MSAHDFGSLERYLTWAASLRFVEAWQYYHTHGRADELRESCTPILRASRIEARRLWPEIFRITSYPQEEGFA